MRHPPPVRPPHWPPQQQRMPLALKALLLSLGALAVLAVVFFGLTSMIARPDPTPVAVVRSRPPATELGAGRTRTATPAPTATEPPTATPTPATVGQVIRGGNLRSDPWVAAGNVIGLVEPGDELEFLEATTTEGQTWYSIKLRSGAQAGATGWASALLLSTPSEALAASVPDEPTGTATGPTGVPTKQGFTTTARPTTRPSTARPATARPRAPTARPATSGGRTGAICRDGTRSYATGRGACSHHGGVDHWLYN